MPALFTSPSSRPEARLHCIEHPQHVDFERDIALDGDGLASGLLDLADGLPRGSRVAGVIDAHGPAAGAGQTRRGTANAPARARDQNDLTLAPFHVSILRYG